MAIEAHEKPLTGADVVAERSRHRITQAELAQELGWYTQVLPPIENGTVELSQEEYRRILAAIDRMAAKASE